LGKYLLRQRSLRGFLFFEQKNINSKEEFIKMSKLEEEALRIFISERTHARTIKKTFIRLAQEEPERVLKAMESLDEKDRKYLRWLKTIADKYLTH
jgi:hypothetical protein